MIYRGGLALLLFLISFESGNAQYRLIAWGDNSRGQTNVPSLNDVTAIAAGHSGGLALRSNGSVVGWGDNSTGQTNVPASVTNAMAIAAGEYHCLAVRSNGTVIGWGFNGSGQLNLPAGLTNIIAVSGGRSHSMALRSNGTVICWGENFDGQTNVPPGLTNVVAIAAGDNSCLAMRGNGTVIGWGDNASGQNNIPLDLTNAMKIAAGYHHNLAVRSNGTVTAWELNVEGESTVPPGLSNVSAVAAGWFFSTALRSNGTVVAWGKNFSGETNVPPTLTNAVAIASGWDHTIAMIPVPGCSLSVPDDFACRRSISGTNISLTVSNVGATFELNEPSHSSLAGDPIASIWLTWTAPVSKAAVITTSASFLFPICAVYTGNALGSLTKLADNVSGYNQNRVVFNAVAGTAYHIALDGLSGDNGVIDFLLQTAGPPANDLFTNRTAIPVNFFETSGALIGATREPGEPTHAGANGDPAYQQTVWWTWTAPTNVGLTNIPVQLTADAISYPPNLGVYTGSTVSNLSPVPTSSQTNGMTRVTAFTAITGTTYQLALGGEHQDATGNNLSSRYGNYRFRLNMRALVVGVTNLIVTNDFTGPISFGATAQVTNYGSAISNPLRVRVAAISGISVRGPDDGFTIHTNYTLYVTNLSALSPGQGRLARVFGTLPAPFEDPGETNGIGYGAYAELQEQFGTNDWRAVDQTVIVFGEWPSLGGFAGPGGGVIRLDPGLTGSAFIPLSSVAVLGPLSLTEGATAAYTGLARYADNSQFSFSNTVWTASRFNITTNGVLSTGIVTSNTPVTVAAKYSSSGFLYEASTNLTVMNLPPPQLVQPRNVAGVFQLQLQGVPNRKHVVEATTNLAPPVIWSILTTNVLSPGGIGTFGENIGSQPRKFFRARETE